MPFTFCYKAEELGLSTFKTLLIKSAASKPATPIAAIFAVRFPFANIATPDNNRFGAYLTTPSTMPFIYPFAVEDAVFAPRKKLF